MCYIRPLPTADTIFTPEKSPNALQVHQSKNSLQEDTPIVILGGYSYGSLILKHLPPVLSILQPFSKPLSGSSAEEVILRAHKLAEQSNLDWINQARFRAHEQKRRKHELKSTVVMGGEDTSPEKRRSSREVRRSTDGSRSLDIKQRLRSLSHRGRRGDFSVTSKRVEITIPEVRYLLVSPLAAPISTLAAPALGPKFWGRARDGSQEMIGQVESLAIYGDQDVFASAKKIRDWAGQLKADHGPRFSSVEVSGAGHFWVEGGVEKELRSALKEWEAGVR
jgi:alpha/beta superfamily hydrolase